MLAQSKPYTELEAVEGASFPVCSCSGHSLQWWVSAWSKATRAPGFHVKVPWYRDLGLEDSRKDGEESDAAPEGKGALSVGSRIPEGKEGVGPSCMERS